MSIERIARWLPLAVCALAAPGALAGAEGTDRATSVLPLFRIQKSNSHNEIHYAAALRSDCRFADTPVRVYWLRRSEPSLPPRDLDWLEDQFVYGVRVDRFEPTRLSFALAADDTRNVTVDAAPAAPGCRVRARVQINGQWATPDYAYVEIDEGATLPPGIAHVDLHGRRADGRQVCERLTALRTRGTPCARP